MTTFKSTAAFATTAIALALAGCIDEQRIRESAERMQAEGAQQYRFHRIRMLQELRNHVACCDNLVEIRPHAELSAGRPYQVTVGVWPNDHVAEFDGFRSYYAMLSLGGAASSVVRISLTMTPSLRGFFDPETKMPAKEFFVPAVTFLDANRVRLGSVNTSPVAVLGAFELKSTVEIPIGAAFVVLHTNRDVLEAAPQPVVLGTGTSVYPIGPVVLITRSQPQPVMALPAVTGSVRASLD